MIQISNGEIYYCGYFIVDLKTPFIKLNKKPQYIKTPIKTIFGKRISFYTLKYKNNYYRLYRTIKNTFRYHSVYKADKSVKKYIKEIVLNECVDNKEIRIQILNYIQKIIEVLLLSCSFDAIITDFAIDLNTDIDHIEGDWNIINIDKIDIFKKRRIKDNKLKIYECKKELRYIDPLYYSDIDPYTIKKYKNILIVSNTNGFYVSYLANYFYRLGVKEILPVTLFLL